MMKNIISSSLRVTKKANQVYLVTAIKGLKGSDAFTPEEIKYANQRDKDRAVFQDIDKIRVIQFIKDQRDRNARLEGCRKAGDEIATLLNKEKADKTVIVDVEGLKDETLAMAEGMALGNYQFLKYKSKPEEKQNTLGAIGIRSDVVTDENINETNHVLNAVFEARDLVNEPLSYLTAEKLGEEFERLGKDGSFKVEVFNKKKIESLKMGGLLAVNKGSVDPPTFTVMEWKPNKPVNKKPVILVGKGVVFDTGGLNLKPGTYMNDMKCDMGGAAIMGATIYAIAKAKLPVHVIALIPATDNRPSGNAYVTGDVITMFDGTQVEVLNTDAEGRMILADALSYAKKYEPELVINAATLTGAASRAIGHYGIVAMEKDAPKEMALLKKSGEEVYERIAEFPFWEEYGELIKSDIADIKNLGGVDAGMITAGKFLAHFTDYPFIHMDIAGPAHIDKKHRYMTKGGTGMGVRLLYSFIKNKYLK
jgi:leucyl aminopeptidase